MNLEQKLFEIKPEVEELFQREAEIEENGVPQAVTSTPEVSKEQLLEYRIRKLKLLECEKAALEAKYKPLIAEMEADIRSIQRGIERQERCIAFALPPGPNSEFIGEAGSVYYSPSVKVVLLDEKEVPLELCDSFEPRPNLKKVGDALKAGAEVPGAQLQTNYNIRIGAGGARGKANSAQRAKKKGEP